MGSVAVRPTTTTLASVAKGVAKVAAKGAAPASTAVNNRAVSNLAAAAAAPGRTALPGLVAGAAVHHTLAVRVASPDWAEVVAVGSTVAVVAGNKMAASNSSTPPTAAPAALAADCPVGVVLSASAVRAPGLARSPAAVARMEIWVAVVCPAVGVVVAHMAVVELASRSGSARPVARTVRAAAAVVRMARTNKECRLIAAGNLSAAVPARIPVAEDKVDWVRVVRATVQAVVVRVVGSAVAATLPVASPGSTAEATLVAVALVDLVAAAVAPVVSAAAAVAAMVVKPVFRLGLVNSVAHTVAVVSLGCPVVASLGSAVKELALACPVGARVAPTEVAPRPGVCWVAAQ